MTTWVLWIAKDYRDHWDLAEENGLWDLPTLNLRNRGNIRAGDHVFFWFGRPGSICSHTVALSDMEPLSRDNGPWRDAGGGRYKSRFTFEVVSAEPRFQPRWESISTQLHDRQGSPVSKWVATDAPEDLPLLAGLFGADVAPYPPTIRIGPGELTGEDLRKRVERSLVVREGQGQFRESLLDAYAQTCAVTGTTTTEVLEAAHISSYRGPHTNVVNNGLLLRSDIHALFDKKLLTITLDLRIAVAPSLLGAEYRRLAGGGLARVAAEGCEPFATHLRDHQRDCSWFGQSA